MGAPTISVRPDVVAASVSTTGAGKGNDRRGQDRRYQRARQGRRGRRLDSPWHRGLRAHGQEVPEGGGPPREAAGRRRGFRVAPARALRRPDRLVARRGRAPPAQAAPHGQEGLRQARRGARLRGVALDRAEVRGEAAGRAGGRARRPRGAGVPAARLAAGERQVGFGQADFRVRGVGLAQVFWSEAPSASAGGSGTCSSPWEESRCAPCSTTPRGVGRRVGAQVVTSELFRRFATRYGLGHSFTDPCSGN